MGQPEGTVATALRARETEKGGRAGTAQWAAALQTPDGFPQSGPDKTPLGRSEKKGRVQALLLRDLARPHSVLCVQTVGQIARLGPAPRL